MKIKFPQMKIRAFIAVILIFFSFFTVWAFLSMKIDDSNRDIINFALGAILGGVLKDISSYYFGGNHSPDKPRDPDEKPTDFNSDPCSSK